MKWPPLRNPKYATIPWTTMDELNLLPKGQNTADKFNVIHTLGTLKHPHTGAPAATKGRGGRFKPEGTFVPNQAWEALVNFDNITASVYNVSKISTVQTLRSIRSLRAYIIVWADFLTSPSTCLWKDQERHFNFFLGANFFIFQCHWNIGKLKKTALYM